MQLLELTLDNFKGVRNLHIDTEGKSISIRGDNGTGKTTVFDAVTWLLFGRDSLDRATFNIKTLDEEGNVIPNLDHSVDATFYHVEHGNIKLKRVYKEVWKKKRGTNSEELSHTTDYYVDGIPKSEKDYKAFVDEIIDKDVFKLLTNPLYFNEKLGYKERRDVLVGLVSKKTDTDLIGDNSEFKPLIDIVSKHSIEEYIKGQKLEKRKIGKRLDEIPARIDELSSMKTTLDSSLDELQEKLTQATQEMQNIEQGLQPSKKTTELQGLYEKLQALRIKMEQAKELAMKERSEDVAELQKALEKATVEGLEKQKERHALLCELKLLPKELEKYQAERQQLLDEFDKVQQPFVPPTSGGTCATCGQALPALSEEDIEYMRMQHNDNIANKKAEIRERGKQVKFKIDDLLADQKRMQMELEEMDVRLKAYCLDMDALEERKRQLLQGNISLSPRMIDIQQEIDHYQELIYQCESKEDDTDTDDKARMQELKNQMQEYTQAIEGHKLNASIDKKIEDYTSEQKRLTSEYDAIQSLEFLYEKFTRFKMETLEKDINRQFKFARFKLFKQLVNGGIEDCCEVTYNGVPYTDLNNASRINIGLDIINTLTGKYGITVPIFVDNAESVTELLPTNSQMIRLIVDESAKQLVVEYI